MFLRFYGSKYHRQLTFSEEAESLLLDYKWPGNIRELENLVQGLAVTSKDSVIRASDVPISGVAKPAASFTAISASIFLFISTPACFKPNINLE